MTESKRTLLGDGLYALDDGDMTWLIAPQDRGPEQAVALEPETFQELLKFMAKKRRVRITVEDLDSDRKWVSG